MDTTNYSLTIPTTIDEEAVKPEGDLQPVKWLSLLQSTSALAKDRKRKDAQPGSWKIGDDVYDRILFFPLNNPTTPFAELATTSTNSGKPRGRVLRNQTFREDPDDFTQGADCFSTNGIVPLGKYVGRLLTDPRKDVDYPQVRIVPMPPPTEINERYPYLNRIVGTNPDEAAFNRSTNELEVYACTHCPLRRYTKSGVAPCKRSTPLTFWVAGYGIEDEEDNVEYVEDPIEIPVVYQPSGTAQTATNAPKKGGEWVVPTESMVYWLETFDAKQEAPGSAWFLKQHMQYRHLFVFHVEDGQMSLHDLAAKHKEKPFDEEYLEKNVKFAGFRYMTLGSKLIQPENSTHEIFVPVYGISDLYLGVEDEHFGKVLEFYGKGAKGGSSAVRGYASLAPKQNVPALTNRPSQDLLMPGEGPDTKDLPSARYDDMDEAESEDWLDDVPF